MQVTRILHASVNHTAAVDETVAFYRDVLGLIEAPRPDIGIPGSWLTVGDAQLHLIGFPSGEGRIDPTRHHVAFGVADLDAALAELREAGVEHVQSEQTQLDGAVVRQVFLVDPAGNTIELQEDRS